MQTLVQDLEIAELRRRLRAERGVRKACERWLRAELRTRVRSGWIDSYLHWPQHHCGCRVLRADALQRVTPA